MSDAYPMQPSRTARAFQTLEEKLRDHLLTVSPKKIDAGYALLRDSADLEWAETTVKNTCVKSPHRNGVQALEEPLCNRKMSGQSARRLNTYKYS